MKNNPNIHIFILKHMSDYYFLQHYFINNPVLVFSRGCITSEDEFLSSRDKVKFIYNLAYALDSSAIEDALIHTLEHYNAPFYIENTNILEQAIASNCFLKKCGSFDSFIKNVVNDPEMLIFFLFHSSNKILIKVEEESAIDSIHQKYYVTGVKNNYIGNTSFNVYTDIN